MKQILLFVLFLLNFTEIHAERTDSLMHALKKAKGQEKMLILEELCIAYYSVNLDSAGYFANQKLQLALKLKDIKGQAQANKLLGNIHYFQGAYDLAINHYQESILLAEKISDDEILASALNNLGNIYRNMGEYDKSKEYYLKVLKLDSAANNPGGIGSSLTNIGNIYLDKSQYAKAIEYYKKALQIAEELNDEPRLISAYNNLGLAYHWISDFDHTSRYYFFALKKAESIGDYNSMVYILINLGSLHQEWGQHKKALELYQQAERISIKLKDALNLVKAEENIGIIHNEMNQPDSALARFEFALVKAGEVNEPKRVSSIYNNMGYSWELKENYKLARSYYEKALNLRRQNEDVDDIASSLNNLGRVAFKMKDYQKATGYIVQSNQLAIYAATRIDNYKLLSEIYNSLGNPSLSLENYKLYAELRDSVFSHDKHKLIQELQTKYETEKKEQEIAKLSAEKEIEMLKNRQSKYYIFGLIAFLLLISSGGLLLLRYVRVNAQHRTIELEQRLLRSQMNPHFIFNALSCIQEYVISKNPLEASSYLANFASLMRAILNNSNKEFITLKEEIETLKHYLQLQKLRYPEKLDYEIKIAQDMDTEDLMIPPMLAQPFIENAVIHGIAKKEEGPGKLIIEFMSQETCLHLFVRDNGPGLQKKEAKLKNDHQSMSIQITNTRINNFKKAYKQKVEFKIRDLSNEGAEFQGVEVFFRLPKITSNAG